jgi:DNA excision repair protein ERCC-2
VYRAWSSWQKVALAQSAIATDAMQSGANEALLALDQPPEALLAAVQRCVGELTELSVNDPLLLGPQGTQWLFEMLHFLTVAERFDHRFMADITVRRATPGRLRTRQSTCISLRNVVPAAILQARWATAHTATLFSATLAPPDFQRNMLGLPEATPWVDVASPFQAAQLQVQVAGHISTRFAQRAASVAPIVTLMARQWQARPGNYLAFFSSFDYLAAVAAAFAQQCPDVPLRCQTRRMPDAERQAFVDQFTPTSQAMAFAVLGGALGEGIDLPGERLVGAFVVTLGLPQVNPVNDAFRQRLQQLFPGRGYDYTYLYPGMHKVVQAAGRVIRTPQDHGVVVLMDARFARREVQALLPGWWG